jgi:uncharacterized membrane protein
MNGAEKTPPQRRSSEGVKDEHLLGGVLTAGVWLSALCLIAGLALTELNRAADRPEGPVPHRLLDVGLIILMATPIARVLVSLFDEIRLRHWVFALITFAVVVLLAATLSVAWRALP